MGEADVLAAVPLFAGLTSADRGELATAAQRVAVEGTGWLFRQGDADDGLYVVVSGRIELSIDEKTVRVVGPGEALGEMALLTAGTRSASARALRDAELLHISRDSFDALIERVPGFARALLRLLALKAAEAVPLQRARDPLRVVAVIGRDGDLARSLAAALPDAVVLGHSDAPADEGEWGRALDANERRAAWVVLDVSAAGGWRDFCLRQADRVVDQPHRAVDAARGRTVGPAAERQRGRARPLRRWRAGWPTSGSSSACSTPASRSTEWAASASARSIGALFAGGMDAAELASVCRAELVAKKPFADYTVPRVSVVRGLRATQMIRRLCGEAHFEDLPRSYFCVTADLLSAQSIVHRSGPVWRAVAASVAIPGYAPPQRTPEGLLVDGGVLNNLPADVMVEEGEGPVIAVDVMRQPSVRLAGERLPGIMETLARATVLGSWARSKANLEQADLVVAPVVEGLGLFEWKAIDAAIDAGRVAADKALAAGWPGR